MTECDEHTHYWEVEEPCTDTPPDRRCICGQYSWGEMDEKLLETWWKLSKGD